MHTATAPSALISGYMDAILLKVISLADAYGYHISKTITHMTHGACEVKEATLYSGLRRLEADKSIAAYWGEESQGGRRKYYTLTQQGSDALAQHQAKWAATKQLVDTILQWEGNVHE